MTLSIIFVQCLKEADTSSVISCYINPTNVAFFVNKRYLKYANIHIYLTICSLQNVI